MSLRSFFISYLLVVIVAAVFSSPATALELTPELQLKVADSFLAHGDYYRAITEYRRFTILFPDSELYHLADYREGEAYFLGGEYQSAISAWQFFRQRHPGSPLLAASHYHEAMALWKKKDYLEAELKFFQVSNMDDAGDYRPRSIGARVLLAMEQDAPDDALGELNRLSALGYPADKTRQEIIAYKDAPRRSPFVASLLSALLPGSGYLYAGRAGDALSAFIVNAAFIYGAVESFDKGNNTAGYLLAGFGLPFYAGNIYGSANAAVNHNNAVDKRFRDRIVVSLDFVF